MSSATPPPAGSRTLHRCTFFDKGCHRWPCARPHTLWRAQCSSWVRFARPTPSFRCFHGCSDANTWRSLPSPPPPTTHTGTILYAWNQHEQFYPAIVFLVTSKVALVSAGNFACALALAFGQGMCHAAPCPHARACSMRHARHSRTSTRVPPLTRPRHTRTHHHHHHHHRHHHQPSRQSSWASCVMSSTSYSSTIASMP
jgi:hypothetical protein